ncbi:hypothetical protein [Coleofasciculus sp. E1-EBD-02]|uniref:hypothetical protein n=1 Tax=Coleofasciculus sp. E1-EBD-02 TaxID=3068481 RepID=UPI0032FEA40A
MKFITRLAASIAVVTVVATPLAAKAQQARPRAITPSEEYFLQILNTVMRDEPDNRLMSLIADWGKADDGRLVCTALELGASPEQITRRAWERSLEFSDEQTKVDFRSYFTGVFLASVNTLCTDQKWKLDEYLQ